MEVLWADVRQALRGLGHSPGFAIAAIGILAVGIAANTSVFSVADAVLFRPLPYENPEQLVLLNEIIPRLTNVYLVLPVNARHFYAWKERSRSFTDTAILREGGVDLTAADGPAEHLAVADVSFNLLGVLRARTLLGRNFTPDEDNPGNDPVVILTEPLWRRRFHSDPGILNQSILLDGVPNKVIGVLPASFRFLSPNIVNAFGASVPPGELFKPIAFTKAGLEEVEGDYNYAVIGRLRRGVTREQALAEMNVLGAALDREFKLGTDLRAAVTSMQENIVSGSRLRSAIWAIDPELPIPEMKTISQIVDASVAQRRFQTLFLAAFAAAALLLAVVGIYRVISYFVNRRRNEMGIRMALGAQLRDVSHMVVLQGMRPVAAGLLAGLPGAVAFCRLLSSLLYEVRPTNPIVLSGVASALTLAAALACYVPARRAIGVDPATVLRYD